MNKLTLNHIGILFISALSQNKVERKVAVKLLFQLFNISGGYKPQTKEELEVHHKIISQQMLKSLNKQMVNKYGH